MQILEPIPQSSFFDDNSENFCIWKKGQSHKKLSEVRIMEGILFKRSSRTGFWKSRYYVLFEDRLAYYKNVRETKEQAHCLIQNMRLEKISNEFEKDEKYGLRLTHNSLYCDLFARSKDQYDKWISVLSSFCVLASFSSNFVTIKMIGKGSFAKVYLVKRKNDNKDLAVKTFDKSLLMKQEKAKASLINEINIMRRLSHDNIIKLHEVYESENNIYLVQELLNGGELFDRIIKKGQYSERDACTLMKKLLSALSYMHSRGIMHRDIKPENLILKDVENDWNVKIADFGLATYINPNGEYLFKRCGTPGYVAPEILADAKYDQKVDVFSAGVILFILLTGGSPFHGKSYNDILWKNKVCEISYDFKAKNLKVSDIAIDLLKKMLAKDPAQRISAEQALKHEWIIVGGSDIAPSTSPYYLSSAQENMKRFQEENRFNVKNIKPKGLDGSYLEKCVHAPSPLITGKVTTIVGSLNQSIMISPDLRTSVMSNKSKVTETASPKFVMSLSGVQQDSSPASTIGDEFDDFDAVSDEQNSILDSIGRYSNGFQLITQVREFNNSSTSSSSRSTPLVNHKPVNQQGSMKRAMNIQDLLLGFIKPNNGQMLWGSNPEHQKKTGIVKDNLKHLH